MCAQPEPGEKGRCPKRAEEPFDPVARQIVGFEQSDAVKRYYE